MSVASKRTALDVSRRYWTDYDAHKVNCSNWDLAMGVNLSLRLVLANSALYDSRVCTKIGKEIKVSQAFITRKSPR